MKKVLIIFLFLANLFTMAKAETFPGEDWGFTKEKYPIYYSYLNDYAKMLYDKFDGKRVMFGDSISWCFSVDRNGNISNMHIDLGRQYFFQEKMKRLLYKNPPPPFYDGMDIEKLKFDVYFGIDDRDEGSFYNFYYNPHLKEFDIGIHKDSPREIRKHQKAQKREKK